MFKKKMPTKNDSMKKQKHGKGWATSGTETHSHLESSFRKEENGKVREKNNSTFELNESLAPLKQRSLRTMHK